MQKLKGILLVDDDEVTNFINTELIEGLDVTDHLQVCENGKEAIEYLLEAHKPDPEPGFIIPDLIFLDMNMPVMDGAAFLDAYKQNFTNADTVITMLSTTQVQEEVFQALMATNLVVSFIEKPLSAEKVNDLVNGIRRVYYHNCKSDTDTKEAEA